MADKYQRLLIEWCDALLCAEVKASGELFGSFRCDSCGFSHGRADNAVYPLSTCYVLTGEERYLVAAKDLLVFRKKLEQPSGAMINDFTSPWQGITAFSAINLMKTLYYLGDKLPEDFTREVDDCARRAAIWVRDNLTVGFPAYINYYCAAALSNALYYVLYHDDVAKQRAKELMAYCLPLFTKSGLLAGEGKPHDDKSPKGCYPIDVGYVAEESLPCLIHAAALLKDEEAASALAKHAKNLLDFMLPDGGWDNSFGVRNNKWSYYGSRTSDGCIGAFAALRARDPLFHEAAERTYTILKRCTHNGLLYGGPAYYESGQKPCVHHTFSHAAALADAIHEGIDTPKERLALPLEREVAGVKYYPEIDTYKIRMGGYLATLTAYDYATHNYGRGAAHAGGGTLSLLYKDGVGAIIAGSVYDYILTEPNNMQLPTGNVQHATLLLRAEYEKDGVKYATCLDKAPVVEVKRQGGFVTATVQARFVDPLSQRAESERTATFYYRFSDKGVTLTVKAVEGKVRLVIPIVKGSARVESDNRYHKRDIFFLTGGFAADEYSFDLKEDVTLTIV